MQGDGWNALHWASQNGHIDVVTILLERVADVNTRNVSDLLTCAELALRLEHALPPFEFL